MQRGDFAKDTGASSEQGHELCAIYTRVSTSAQAEEGVSLEAQRDYLNQAVKLKGWEVSDYYEDAGYTGTNTERPQLQRMRADARKHRFTKVAIYKLDRLTRSVKDFCDILHDDFEPNGVSVYAPTQDLNTDTSAGKLTVNILASFAAFESDLIKERTRLGYAKLKVDRRLLGPAPYGYFRKDKKLFPHDPQLDLVKEVYSMYLEGKSERQIAHAHPADLSRDLVRDILSNPVYCAKVAYGRRVSSSTGTRRRKYSPVKALSEWDLQDLDQDYIKPVVSFEKWQAVQARRETFPTHRPSQTVALFQGLLYCSHCDHFLSTHGCQKKGTKYSCDSDHKTRMKKPLSEESSVALPNGTKWFCGQQLLEDYLEAPIVDALEVALKDFKPRLKLAKKLKGAQESLKRAQREFDLTARRALSSDQITEGQVKTYIAEAQRKVDVRKEELQVLKDEASSELAAKDALKPDFRSFYGSITKSERKEFLSIFVRRIDVGDTFLTAHWWFSDGMTRISRDEVMPKKGSKFENAVVVLSNGLAGDPDVAGSSGAGVSTIGQIYQNRGSSTTVDKRAHSGRSLSFDAGCEVGKTMVEIGGLEPPTSCMPCRRSPS